MGQSDVILYVFLVFLALFFVWVGREFIRARRRRAEEARAEEEPAEAEAQIEPEAPVEPVEEGAEAEAPSEPVEEPAEPVAPVVEPVTEEKAEAEAPAEPVEEPAEPVAAATPAVPALPEIKPAVKPAAKPAVKPSAPAKVAAPAKPTPVPAPVPERKVEPAPTEAPAEPQPAVEALTVPVPKPTPVLARKELVEVPEPEAKRLKKGLAKTRKGFVARLGRLFRGKKTIDADMLEHLEEVLFTADIGVRTSGQLFKDVKDALDRKSLKDPGAIWTYIKDRSVDILNVESSPMDLNAGKPFVILTVGVNGVGKTTTIGKLAARFRDEGKKVLLAAGDTFRAAAVEQLLIWGHRTGAPVVQGKPNADPSSVVFDAIKKAQDEGTDVVIADTAGRLHTKVGLMDELKKIHRVTGKAQPGAPHETLLVLDATNGQNAIQQANMFTEAVKCTGIVLTKLDGTAKGGIILGICDELKMPVRFVGIGERVEDLRVFDPQAFVEALYSEAQE